MKNLFSFIITFAERRNTDEKRNTESPPHRIEKIVNREWNARQEHKIKLLLKKSELKYKGAYIDDNAFLDITILQGTKEKRLSYDWIDEGHNVILSGPTGCGKSFMACALTLGGIHRMYKVYYIKAGLLAEELIIASRDRQLKEKSNVITSMTSWLLMILN